MSEHDYWQVESSVYGGVGYAPATLEEYAAIAKALDDEAAGFAAIATAWESAALQLQSHRHSAPMCVTLQSGDPSALFPAMSLHHMPRWAIGVMTMQRHVSG